MRAFMLLAFSSLFLFAQFPAHLEAASSKKKTVSRKTVTPEQRHAIMLRARKLCKDKFGPTSTVYMLEIRATSFQVRCSNY